MPAVRLSRRRRSSHAIFSPAKAGAYGASSRPVTFAPNVTPVTFTEIDDEDPLASLAVAATDPSAGPSVKALTAKLFPPLEAPTAPTTRKRCPPGKRMSQGYIPRPPNAFMLFRADFVKQKHVPGAIETNHGSLSKIIGTCWRELAQHEKHVWEVKAKQEKAAHKAMYPDYRFRPVHNKNKQMAKSDTRLMKEKHPSSAEEERRCEDVAHLLMQGKKGEELAAAVRTLDRARSRERELEMELGLDTEYGYGLESRRSSFGYPGRHQESRGASPTMPTLHMPASSLHLPFGMNTGFAAPSSSSTMNAPYHRRASSVPLPNEWFSNANYFAGSSAGEISLPSVPSFISRPVSPVCSISRFNQGQGFQQQEQQFPSTNSFQQPQPESYQFTFVPPSAEFNAQTFPSQTPQQSLFHSQHFMQTAPWSSLGLGHRRASSAQPFLRRSWTMPMPVSNYDFGTGADMEMQMPMERDHSPLPDVDPELFANFSFGNGSATQQSNNAPSVAGSIGGNDEVVDPASPTRPPTSSSSSSPYLAPIDTSIPPLSHSSQPSSQSASTSTSSSGSPPPSFRSDPRLSISAYMHVDGLYAADSGFGVYEHEHDGYGAMGMGMGGMYAYDVDPVVSSRGAEREGGYFHTPKPTEANLAQDMGMGGDEGAYFESA